MLRRLNRAMRARRALDGERGASTIETFGVVTVAVLLSVALIFAFTTFKLGDRVAIELCKIVSAVSGGSGASCGEASAPAAQAPVRDYQPPVCMLSETSETYGSEVKIAFITIGNNSGFIVQQYGQDGPVKVTATDGGSIGAEGGVGGKFNIGNLGSETKAGADVNFGGDVKFDYGDTWEFKNQAEYTKFKDQLDTYLMQQEMLKQEGGVYAIKAMGGFEDAPDVPTIKVTTMGVEAGVDAGIGLREPTGGKDENGKDEYVDPNVGAFLSLDGAAEVVKEMNVATGETTYTYQLSGGAEAGIELVAGSGSAGAEGQGAFSVTRDKSNKVTAIEFKTVGATTLEGKLGNDTFDAANGGASKGEGNSTMTTTRLEVDDTNRAQVDAWLAERGDAFRVPLSAVVPDKSSSDPFDQLLYEQATVSQVEYENIQDGFAFGAAVKLGLQLGFSFSMEESTATAVDAKFLGAPGTDSVRPWVDDTVCTG